MKRNENNSTVRACGYISPAVSIVTISPYRICQISGLGIETDPLNPQILGMPDSMVAEPIIPEPMITGTL